MEVIVVGGGLAGVEAAWQVAEAGFNVILYEMRPIKTTGAHITDNLAELVCSNSLGSNLPDRASGLLKAELRRLGSLLISCADASSLPAGSALAVDRELFTSCIQKKLETHPKITIIRKEITKIPESPGILATGPLTSPALSLALSEFTGSSHLFFYDAIAPIVEAATIDFSIAFKGNRYEKGITEKGDYINCPLNKSEYDSFRETLVTAKRFPLRPFEQDIEVGVDAGAGKYFQGCQPIEIIAMQGEKSLAFGPLRPVGIRDPKTGQRPYAVVQLRQDNLAGSLYNLVGFQTNLTVPEQKRVFKMIPGLENAKFVRFGQMHRNAYILSPLLLDGTLAFKQQPGLYVAGQLAGFEGYAGNIASGLVAGINMVRFLGKSPPVILPNSTMIGALVNYVAHAEFKDFQPIKAVFGLLPKPDDGMRRSKKDRYHYYSNRALKDLDYYLHAIGL